ncbi:hypothetical protein BJY04DRAFT_102940 [Aspergillus karnatakaensis]|uniref:uncharacterized protein n=1 Tax=Aspergillus karnatakaensis TaxID=1810916 RepID=UPI003CCDAA49
MSTPIPRFLLPRGMAFPSTRAITLTLRTTQTPSGIHHRSASSKSKTPKPHETNPRVLAQPDKFRPPSHPARRVVPTRNGKVVNYPGPKLSEKEEEERRTKRYPNMFPPEGTVMFRFLTSRWIHIWIAMGVLTSLATFTFTTNFKATSPFAHLLPPWSALFSHPIDTISQALSVYRMHVQHNSVETRERRLRRVEDAEKRRQYRVAHGLEEPSENDKKESGVAGPEVDVQSPIAVEAQGGSGEEYVDFEGKRRPVKKWLGIW